MNDQSPLSEDRREVIVNEPHYLDLIHQFEAELRIKIVTPEVEIILALYETSPLSIPALQAGCSASAAKFYMILKRLQDSDVISRSTDPADKRRSLYELSAEARTFIFEAFGNCVDALRSADLDDHAKLLAAIDETKQRICNHYGISFTSFRYNILASLFRLGNWHPSDGQKLAETSQVSFYNVMEDLKSIGAIECFEDPNDRRKKRCRLSEPTQKTFSATVRNIIENMLDHAEHRAFAVAPLALLFFIDSN